MIQRIAAALVASLALVSPASARVESGTPGLLKLLGEYGVTVLYNPSRCSSGKFHGSYAPATKTMSLCYQGTPGAEAHDTVRHEAWHVVQHCATSRRGQYPLYPVALDESARRAWLTKSLTSRAIAGIKEAYPAEVHAVELEAFAAARVYSAADIGGYIRAWCTKSR